MNFDPYSSRGQLAAPAANFTKPAPLQYDNSGERALVKANAETGLVIAEGFNKWREQYDQGKVMEANNEYNRLMSEGTAELMQRKEEAALNIVQDYDKLHQKTMDKINKQYGQFIRFGKAAEAFNVYTGRDNNTRRQNMMKYQMAETDKFHETQYQNQLATCQQMAADGGFTDLSIDEACNRAEPLVRSRLANYGEEAVKQQMRAVKSEIVGQAFTFAVQSGDYARVGSLANKYGSMMDAKTRVTALSMLGKRQRNAHDLYVANDMVAKYGTNATYEDIKKSVESEKRNGNNFSKRAESYLGVTMDEGRNGCVENVVKVLSGCSTFGANNVNQRNVGNLYRAALEENSGASVFRYNGQTLREGDIMVYVTPGDDISNPDNFEHVTMSDGNGGYYGNSSSARDYVDENGDYVRGNGCSVHADEQEIDGYEIAYVIRPDDIAAKEMSDLEIEEETNRRWKIYQEKVGRIHTVNNQLVKQGTLRMADLRNHGVMDEEQYQAVVNEFAFQGGVVNDEVRISLETNMRQTLSVLEKEAAREARQASGVGGASDGKKNSDPFFQSRIETLLRSGASREQCYKLIAEENPSGAKDLLNFVDKYFAEEGKFAEKWGDYKDIVAQDCGLSKNDPNFDFLYSQATDYAYELIQQYRAEHGGREPTAEQKKDYILDGMTKNQVDTGERGWFGGVVYEESPLTRGQWLARGVYNDPAADHDRNRGLYYVQTKNGMYTATEEQYQRIVAGEDADVVLS